MRRCLLVLLTALVATLVAPPAPAAAASRASDGCWTHSCGFVDGVRVTSISRLSDGRISVRYENRKALNSAARIRLVAEFPATYRQRRIDDRLVKTAAGRHTTVLARPPALYGEVHVMLEMRARQHLEQRGFRRLNTPARRTSFREVTAAQATAESVALTAIGVGFTLTAKKGVTAAKIAARAGATYGGFQALSDVLESNRVPCPGRLQKGQFLRHQQRLGLRQGSSGVVQTHVVTLWHDRASYERGVRPACTATSTYRY